MWQIILGMLIIILFLVILMCFGCLTTLILPEIIKGWKELKRELENK
ncbi:MAG: hypothetical protein E7H33_09840 [Clostridium perfringens]|nr:hypothetical protein [Clostridium perfringens]MDU4051206.1 hypothetical protein [Clostridium perfringens]